MNWRLEAERRREVYVLLNKARGLAVLDSDRMACRMLNDLVARARWKVEYAEKMQRVRRFDFTSNNAQFATRDNVPNNARPGRS